MFCTQKKTPTQPMLEIVREDRKIRNYYALRIEHYEFFLFSYPRGVIIKLFLTNV